MARIFNAVIGKICRKDVRNKDFKQALSKKAKKKIDQLKRNSWNGLDPSTRIVPDKKKYTRKIKHKENF